MAWVLPWADTTIASIPGARSSNLLLQDVIHWLPVMEDVVAAFPFEKKILGIADFLDLVFCGSLVAAMNHNTLGPGTEVVNLRGKETGSLATGKELQLLWVEVIPELPLFRMKPAGSPTKSMLVHHPSTASSAANGRSILSSLRSTKHVAAAPQANPQTSAQKEHHDQ